MNKRKILITGVNGFIGKSLFNYVKKEYPKYKVMGIDLHCQEETDEVLQCDLFDVDKLKGILTDIYPDYISHLSGIRKGGDLDSIRANVLATKSLLDVIRNINNPSYNPRIVIIGSAAEYGSIPQFEFIEESCQTNPVGFYGLVKLMQTRLSLMYHVNYGMDIIIGRVFNVSGKNTPVDLSLGNFAKQIVEIENATRINNIETKGLSSARDFLDIDDICNAFVLLMEKGSSGETYNICSNISRSIREMLECLLSFSKVSNIEIIEEISKDDQILNVVGSNKKITSNLGWQPKVDIKESLLQTLESYRV